MCSGDGKGNLKKMLEVSLRNDGLASLPGGVLILHATEIELKLLPCESCGPPVARLGLIFIVQGVPV